MGDIADMMLEGILDMETGEYLGDATGYPRTKKVKNTKAQKNIAKVRKELALLFKQKESEGDKQALNNARKEINLKYGKGWRERGLVSNGEQWKPLSEYK